MCVSLCPWAPHWGKSRRTALGQVTSHFLGINYNDGIACSPFELNFLSRDRYLDFHAQSAMTAISGRIWSRVKEKVNALCSPSLILSSVREQSNFETGMQSLKALVRTACIVRAGFPVLKVNRDFLSLNKVSWKRKSSLSV